MDALLRFTPLSGHRRGGRGSRRVTAAALAALLLVASCTSHTAATVTVTSQVTAANPSVAAPPASPATASRPSVPPGSSSKSSATPSTTRPAPTPSSSAPSALGGFVPTKLRPGQKAPQFIVVSFDGVGWHEKWQYWRDIAAKVPFRFTGFLTGVYLLSNATKDKYQGPGHGVGKSSVGWNAPKDVPAEIADLNRAYQDGDEIASHFNGHFRAGDNPSGKDWSTSSWNDELNQFFALMKNVQGNNHLPATETLAFGPAEVIGERTPCLEGTPEALYPALTAHHMSYDSSFTRRGISWPTQSHQYKIWQFGMAEFPVHGTSHFQITMDYNFYFTQRGGSSAGVTSAQSARDSTQVQATYQDMYNATTAGNRAPLILGNHFNEWNNSAYSQALGKFLLANCAKPDTHCVSFRDLITWMNIQDPAVLTHLQQQAPEMGPPGQ